MKFLIITVFTCFAMNVFAQKQILDVLSYSIPAKWQKVQNEGGVQLSVSDKKTGGYAIAIITKATASVATANENFKTDWTRLVNNTVQVNGGPTIQEPSTENGWEIVSGNAIYTEAAGKGSVTLLTATGGGKMVSVVLMTNTQQYQNELLSFVDSLELTRISQNETGNSANTNQNGKSTVVGLWCDYILETTGYSINGMQQYTAGYLRKEYTFYSDGTYLFRNKQWLTKAPDITFMYETGTYTVQNSQLTLTPKSGKAGFWGKKSSTKEWGPLKKSSDYKLEKTTYTFEIIIDPDYGTSIVLKPSKPTQRDGGQFNAAGEPYEFRYSRKSESLIDNPPGFENKSLIAATKKDAAVTINSPLTGKIWEGTTTEKFSNAGSTGYNTGGFATNQYQFNTDGTYHFVSVSTSHFTDTKSLQYETGTFTISGNQLTVTPTKGYNEEWSKIGKTSNGNSDVTNRAINETWGKKLKTSSRKLETVTYTFSISKNGDRTALILQFGNGHTEREGGGNQTYLNETAQKNAVKLPAGINW